MRQRILVSGAMLALTVWLGYFAKRSDFGPFIGAYGLFFGLYALLVFWKKPTGGELRWYVGLGIALRIVLLFSLPHLSDDFYRFLWDGRLLAQGINPFAHPPDFFIQSPTLPAGLTPELFSKLNSPHYFTVYPPVCQVIFALAAWLFPTSDWGAVVVMKLFLLGCELGTIRLLGRWRVNSKPFLSVYPSPSPEGEGSLPSDKHAPLPLGGGAGGGVNGEEGAGANNRSGTNPYIAHPALLYALNPLILLEIMGNCHFEGAMICFLFAGMLALWRGRITTAALWLALATAAKLLPPLFLPLIWRWLGWRRGLYFVLIFSAITALLFAPVLQMDTLTNMGSSLRLYFRQFEFNASLYYLVKFSGHFFTVKEIGRTVGPILGLLTVATVLALSWLKVRRNDLPANLLAAMTLAASVYLFDATTVHPWYVTVPLALSTGARWRFPLLWSGLAALSYSHYAGGGFQENFWLIALEYSIVWAFLLWEIWKPKPLLQSFELSPTK